MSIAPWKTVIVLVLMMAPIRCRADFIFASDSGFYNSLGRHSKVDGAPPPFGGATPATFNYSVGIIDDTLPYAPPGSPTSFDIFRKNYFTFSLAGYTPGSITSGSLKVFLPASGYSDGGLGSLTYKLYGSVFPGPTEMGTFATALKGVHSPFVPAELAMSISNYTKLGETKTAFPEFGSITVTAGAAGSTLDIPLTTTGVSYLNLFAGGELVLAGELAGIDPLIGGPVDHSPVFLFGFSSPVIPGVVPWDMSSVTPTPTPILEITAVPELGSAISMGLVLCLLGIGRYRRDRN
jgi:hypothetical protein